MMGAPHSVLPPLDSDLAALARVITPGKRQRGWPGRDRDLAGHLDKLRPEFQGRSQAAYLLAQTIVVLRRDPGDGHAAALFGRLVGELGPGLAAELSLRWLISVCDTVADLPGMSLAERSLAMLGTSCANIVKLAETERRLYHAPRPWPPHLRFAEGHEMFDGLKAFWPERGDMIDNLLRRLGLLLDEAGAAGSTIAPFVAEIVVRLIGPETVLGRMERLKGQPRRPLVDDDLRAGIAALMARL